MWQSAAIAVIGIWTIIVPFFGGTRAFYIWENFSAGIVISLLGFSLSNSMMLRGFLGIVIGFWLLVSSYVPSLQVDSGRYWNDITTGIIAALIGLYSLVSPVFTENPRED